MFTPHYTDVIFIDPNTPDTYIRHDQGYTFGLQFFETILVTDHGIFLKEHVQRLQNSLDFFNIPIRISVKLIQDIIAVYNLHHVGLKLCVSQKNIIASTRPLSYTQEKYKTGLHITHSPILRPSTNPFAHHKSGHSGDLYFAYHQARQQGFDDCIFFNEKGHLTESSIANIFLIKEDTIYTPPLEDGILPGIVRQILMAHYPIVEQSLTSKELLCSQGVFLTNSLMGIMHVNCINTSSYIYDAKIQALQQHYTYLLEKKE